MKIQANVCLILGLLAAVGCAGIDSAPGPQQGTQTSGTPSPTPGSTPSGAAPNAARLCPAQATVLNETYHEPVTGNVPSGISFLSNWVTQTNAGGYQGIQAMDSCRMHADGFLTSHGKPASRVEVNPGDDPIGAGTERAEVLSMQDQSGTAITESTASGTQYYALSYYFPATWDGTQISGNSNSWSVVMQLYGWGALWAAKTSANGPQHYWFTLGGQTFNFSDGGGISKGKWTDFVFQINYANGMIAIYRREEGQAKFIQVASGSAGIPPSGIYFKQGLYRGPDVSGRTDVLWIGPTARGTSFATVEQAAFSTSAGF